LKVRIMRWHSIVFDDKKMKDEVGCDVCGVEIGDEGREFYQPRIDDATEDDEALVRELEIVSECDWTESWVCPSCRERIESAAVE